MEYQNKDNIEYDNEKQRIQNNYFKFKAYLLLIKEYRDRYLMFSIN